MTFGFQARALRLTGLHIDIGHQHFAVLLQQPLGRGQAQAARTAGDHTDLS